MHSVDKGPIVLISFRPEMLHSVGNSHDIIVTFKVHGTARPIARSLLLYLSLSIYIYIYMYAYVYKYYNCLSPPYLW